MNILTPQELRDHIQSRLDDAAIQWVRERALFTLDTMGVSRRSASVTDSPIEQLFYVAWHASAAMWQSLSDCVTVDLVPQMPVRASGANYRLDFGVSYFATDPAKTIGVDMASSAFPRIAIELDGHEFHERTKAQVEQRNSRDRDLLVDGWKVFHFAGSEVVRNPVRCALDVARYAVSAGDAAFYQLWAAV